MGSQGLDGGSACQTQPLPASLPEGDRRQPDQVVASRKGSLASIENPEYECARTELLGDLVEARSEEGARTAFRGFEGHQDGPRVLQQSIKIAPPDSCRPWSPSPHFSLPVPAYPRGVQAECRVKQTHRACKQG